MIGCRFRLLDAIVPRRSVLVIKGLVSKIKKLIEKRIVNKERRYLNKFIYLKFY